MTLYIDRLDCRGSAVSREVVAAGVITGRAVKVTLHPRYADSGLMLARTIAAARAERTVAEVLTAAGIFGGNSDGGMRMTEWLDVMCRGCKHERVSDRKAGIGGGCGCEPVTRAICDPYTAPMPEWTRDAEWPERFAELDQPNPWPVCTGWEPRKKRSDAGRPRRARGMEPMFEIPGGGL